MKFKGSTLSFKLVLLSPGRYNLVVFLVSFREYNQSYRYKNKYFLVGVVEIPNWIWRPFFKPTLLTLHVELANLDTRTRVEVFPFPEKIVCQTFKIVHVWSNKSSIWNFKKSPKVSKRGHNLKSIYQW